MGKRFDLIAQKMSASKWPKTLKKMQKSTLNSSLLILIVLSDLAKNWDKSSLLLCKGHKKQTFVALA